MSQRPDVWRTLQTTSASYQLRHGVQKIQIFRWLLICEGSWNVTHLFPALCLPSQCPRSTPPHISILNALWSFVLFLKCLTAQREMLFSQNSAYATKPYSESWSLLQADMVLETVEQMLRSSGQTIYPLDPTVTDLRDRPASSVGYSLLIVSHILLFSFQTGLVVAMCDQIWLT